MKLNRPLAVMLTLLLSSIISPAFASLVNLGAASNYNAFIQQNFSATSSDVEGRLAAGGTVDISNYSVNIKAGDQLYSDTSEQPALVVGGDLNLSSGQIAGDVYVGGNYTSTSTGTITNGTATIGGVSPVDFAAEFANLRELSANLALLAANSVASDTWSSQYLVGAGENGLGNDLHVFNLDASDMQFSDYFLSAIDDGDTVLFNVAGTNISTGTGNFAGSDHSLENISGNILFNFYEAETLEINAALFGSILAPTANIDADYGVIWGQVIAKSWQGNAQINDNPFKSNRVDIPEPSSIAIFALGLVGLLIRTKTASSNKR
ncbi:MAG: choice-of-anchor A family protein [Thalassotalea sp.]